LFCNLNSYAEGLPLLNLKQAAPIERKGTLTLDGKTVVENHAKKAPVKIDGEDEEEIETKHPKGEYESLGTGTYCEGLFSYFDAPSQLRWEVEIEESVDEPGWYRLQPYKDWNPITELIGECDPTYIYINATDPDFVWFEDIILYEGRFVFTQLVPDTGWKQGWFEYGRLEDGIINMEDAWFCTFNYELDRWEHCDDGFLAVGLPGVNVPDYTLKAASEFHDKDNAPTVIFEYGTDIAHIYVAIATGYIEVDNATAQFIVKEGDELPLETNRWIVAGLDEKERGVYSICLVGCDKSNEIVSAATTLAFVEHDDAENWEPLGRGYWQEGIVSPHINGISMMQLNVDIEKHKTIEGYYRLVNPLAEHPQLSEYLVEDPQHQHYIYINATDPDAVYLEASELGLQTPNGQSAVWSYAGMRIVDGYTVESLKQYGYFGTLIDGVITIPDNQLLYAETNYFGGQFINSGDRFKVDLYHTVPGSAGVTDEITTDEGEAEYFNLQGVKVDKPVKGLYIRRQAGKTTKEFIR
ncbi:MAG: hypothetical protein K2K00_02945, partial [Muribaculaceae bacterium]|nr:hypothetical protein [Muribaculaceae bacterium]